VVNTDIVTGHVDSRVVGWPDHRKAMENILRNQRYVVGLLG
jgi:hypothetical protein